MFNEHDFLTSRHKITLDSLTCRSNQPINQLITYNEKNRHEGNRGIKSPIVGDERISDKIQYSKPDFYLYSKADS